MVKKKINKKKTTQVRAHYYSNLLESIRVSWVYIHALQKNRRYALRKMLYLKYM